MPEVRSLRDLFDDLAQSGGAADPARLVADAGHGALPDQLLAEAVSSYAGSAGLPVATALSDFTSAWADGTIHGADATRGLELLVGAGAGTEEVSARDPWGVDVDPASDLDTDTTGVLDGLWPTEESTSGEVPGDGGPPEAAHAGDDLDEPDAGSSGPEDRSLFDERAGNVTEDDPGADNPVTDDPGADDLGPGGLPADTGVEADFDFGHPTAEVWPLDATPTEDPFDA